MFVIANQIRLVAQLRSKDSVFTNVIIIRKLLLQKSERTFRSILHIYVGINVSWQRYNRNQLTVKIDRSVRTRLFFCRMVATRLFIVFSIVHHIFLSSTQKRERIVGIDTNDVLKCIYGVFSRENRVVTPMRFRCFTPARVHASRAPMRFEKNWA